MAQQVTTQNFQSIYQHLPSPTAIRVLHYEGYSAAPEKLLKCRLEVIELDSEGSGPVYDALSYVWGSLADPSPVECNSNLITIGKTLQDALVNIWEIQPSERIWADALCISQTDLVEKSAQVAMMHRIFAQAANVLVWLGPSFEQSIEVMRCMGNLGGKAAGLLSTVDRRRIGYRAQREQALVELKTLLGPINQLANHPWFTRMWTFQEIAVSLNAQVICGHEWLPWRTFQDSVILLAESISYKKWATHTEKEQSSNLTHHLKDLEYALNITRLPGTRLQQLLIATRHRQASDDHDRVFALLNMVKGEDKSAVPIDYAASVSDIFTKTTLSSIHSSGNLDVLRMAGLHMRKNSSLKHGKRHPELPSWVPNWLDADLLDVFFGARQQWMNSKDEDPFEDDENRFEAREEDEEPSRDSTDSVPQSILQCRLRTRAILLLSPAQHQAALYPIQGSLAMTFAWLVAISIIYSTRTSTHMTDALSAYAPQWVSTVGQHGVALYDHFGTRVQWENGDVLASRRRSSDLYLLRGFEGALDDKGIYMHLVAVVNERSMEGVGLDPAECMSDECVLNIC